MPKRHPAVPSRAGLTPNPSGVHFLSSPKVIDALVRSSGLGADDLAVDLGAGPGAITAALAGTGSRVLAVERDDEFVRRLRRRFADRPLVRVVPGDIRTVSLPRNPFAVVASIPFGISTVLMRRLLTPRECPLSSADLVVQWAFAKRIVAAMPRDLETAWWAARFELRIAGRVGAASFRPRPAVDAAHLVVRRRSGVDDRTLRAVWALLGAVYAAPRRPVRRVVGPLLAGTSAQGLLAASRINPGSAAGDVPVRSWLALAGHVAAQRSSYFPPLPRKLDRTDNESRRRGSGAARST